MGKWASFSAKRWSLTKKRTAFRQPAQSINNFDLPPIMGVTLYGAFFIVVFSAAVDFAYAYLDPRIRPT